MSSDKYAIELTPYEYGVLNKNRLIATVCKNYLETATTVETDEEDVVELLLTLSELEDLTGYVAAEANHARTIRQQEDLGAICDYLEGYVSKIKRIN
jgi:hypothetical protein